MPAGLASSDLLGQGHVHGYNNMTEAVRQMRGMAANQVEGVETAFVSAGRGGMIMERDQSCIVAGTKIDLDLMGRELT